MIVVCVFICAYECTKCDIYVFRLASGSSIVRICHGNVIMPLVKQG